MPGSQIEVLRLPAALAYVAGDTALKSSAAAALWAIYCRSNFAAARSKHGDASIRGVRDI